MNRETHIIDVDGKPLGRVATHIAGLLSGKHKTKYQRNEDGGDFVVVKNIEKIKISGDKENRKMYYSHSGYPGGLKEAPYKKLSERDALEPLKRAVYGMLPKNKLRSRMIKRLKADNSEN